MDDSPEHKMIQFQVECCNNTLVSNKGALISRVTHKICTLFTIGSILYGLYQTKFPKQSFYSFILEMLMTTCAEYVRTGVSMCMFYSVPSTVEHKYRCTSTFQQSGKMPGNV